MAIDRIVILADHEGGSGGRVSHESGHAGDSEWSNVGNRNATYANKATVRMAYLHLYIPFWTCQTSNGAIAHRIVIGQTSKEAGLRHRRDVIMATMAGLAIGLCLATQPALAATDVHLYGGVAGDTSFNGVDGYIRGSTTTAVPSNKFRLNFVNLCRTGDCLQWVQLGEYQGDIGTLSSSTQLRMYIENSWYTDPTTRCLYDSTDLGVPAEPNQAYYISYTGVSVPVNECGSVAYINLRFGSDRMPTTRSGSVICRAGRAFRLPRPSCSVRTGRRFQKTPTISEPMTATLLWPLTACTCCRAARGTSGSRATL